MSLLGETRPSGVSKKVHEPRASRQRAAAFALLAWLTSCSLSPGQPVKTSGMPPLQTGDLVFFDLDCGKPCDAIEDVTLEQFHVDGPRLSHVGLIVVETHGVEVLEAWPGMGVQRLPLDAVLLRSKPTAVHYGRLRSGARSAGIAAVAKALGWLGRPYDEPFTLGPEAFYCSELVLLGFESLAAQGTDGKPWFVAQPMTFGAPGSHANLFWSDYYRKLERPIPEGLPGVSPLGLYLQGRGRIFD